MRLSSTLLSVTVALLLASGSTLGEHVQTSHVASPNLVQPVGALQNIVLGGKRLLRTIEDADRAAEERASFSDLNKIAGKLSTSEEAKIKALAWKFKSWHQGNKEPADVTGKMLNLGFKEHQAIRMGGLYEKYLKDPAFYH
uniref:RxLR effector protein n=1 Tax=Phytophthora agathidicida TaxID=1642459 RepID=A0A7G4WI00_9STRA|nr:PaRXLR11 [Phytophthora agathidicida]